VIIIKVCNDCNENKPYSEFYAQEKTNAKGESYTYYPPYCKECASKRASKYQRDNPEWTKSYAKKIYRRKKQYFKEKAYRWKDKNEEYARSTQREWRRSHPDRIKEYREETLFHKKHEISGDELNELYRYADSNCMYCGISEELAIEKYKQRLHKDHAYNEGSNGIDNCILACKSCNSSKRDNDWDVWYTLDNPKYTEERYIKINQWLEKFH
jgi:hypothetical protein